MSRQRIRRWVAGSLIGIAAAYLALTSAVAVAMLQPPVRFGQIMRRVPVAVVWGVAPGKRLWTWARRGNLAVGDLAPDFTLPTQDRRAEVTLSSFRGRRPVVLVFGSYT